MRELLLITDLVSNKTNDFEKMYVEPNVHGSEEDLSCAPPVLPGGIELVSDEIISA